MTFLLLILWLRNRTMVNIYWHFYSSFENMTTGLLAFWARVLLWELCILNSKLRIAEIIEEIIKQSVVISHDWIDTKLIEQAIKDLVPLLGELLHLFVCFLDQFNLFALLHFFS